ncbi:hypothetical protein F2Q69_00054847 [Brassica cretica]|uniref:HMG box domain-containing protein n=1 Tax=Brassica cretica TaxID=69181 RepID=A0A8S9MU73_BRACR|nr:hypothetical protein F2Q69_00054847 [Brassica cretica]
MPAKSIMKVAKSQTETRSSKSFRIVPHLILVVNRLSLNKMPAKVGKPAAKDPKKPKRPGFRQAYKKEHPNNKFVAAEEGTKENEESVKPVCEENNVDDPEAESWVRRS